MKKCAFIGDLHFYDGVTKSHKDYFQNCVDRMTEYTAEFEKSKPDYIFLSGDIIGLSERVLRTRAALMLFSQYIQKWQRITGGNVFVVRGNHDLSKGESVSDFDLLCSMGILNRADYVDINGLRVHLIDYGDEHREVAIDPDKHNFAVMHANLQIDGVTTWFHADEGIALSSLDNLKGCELVLAGHIHNPSPKVYTTSIEDESVSLFYLGCAMRPTKKDLWSGVYVIYATCEDNGDVAISCTTLMLPACADVFNERALVNSDDTTEQGIADEAVPVVNIELLTQILDELSPALMGSELEYRTQIKRLAGVDTRAADLAIKYIDFADEHASVSDKRNVKLEV